MAAPGVVALDAHLERCARGERAQQLRRRVARRVVVGDQLERRHRLQCEARQQRLEVALGVSHCQGDGRLHGGESRGGARGVRTARTELSSARVGELAFIVHREKSDATYAPSFDFDEPLLAKRQASIHDEVASIDGWLEPVDSLKLYELAYLADGPFLEIGTYRGKSTTLIATAL